MESAFIGALVASLALWIYSNQPNATFGWSNHPIYHFSLAIYAVQGAAITHYFRTRVDGLQTLGLVSCGLVSSVSLYELIFKVSFPFLDPSHGRISYLLGNDLFFLIFFFAGIPAYLVSRNFWRLRADNRVFIASCLVALASWISWWGLCFPLDVQIYETHFMSCPWVHNVVTKAAISSLYVTVLERRSVAGKG